LRELILRAFIGGAMVTVFAELGDLFKPKRFAGLFGAAPSIALATLLLAIAHDGKSFAIVESRSMIAGAAAFLVYACCVSHVLFRYRRSAMLTTLLLIPVWFAVSFGIWSLWLR
jgi:Protein of unknown function (DUF3147)